MNQQERLAKIIELLEEREQLKQEEIADYFNVSKDTARRDILKLVEENLVERTRGGIQLPIIKEQITAYKNRLVKNSTEKKIISHLAASFIQQNQTIWLDVSTTVELLANDTLPKKTLMITNSVDNAVAFSPFIKEVYLLGGYYQADSHLLKGPMLMTQLMNFHFDVAFIGATGVSIDGIFFDELEDIDLHQQVSKQSKKTILLVDSNKINQETPFKINWELIDILISNQPIPVELENILINNNIQLIIP